MGKLIGKNGDMVRKYTESLYQDYQNSYNSYNNLQFNNNKIKTRGPYLNTNSNKQKKYISNKSKQN